jgi:hypothetical protein
MPHHKIDMDEVYRNETRERFQRAQRSFEFAREMERTR